MAQSWRGGIGKYPPIPERFGNTSRCPEAKPREEGGISRPRRMRWVFSNPTEPWLCHCHCNSEKNKYCQEVYIDQWKPLDNSKFFPIVKRFTLINVNLPTIVKFYYCQEVYIVQCKPPNNIYFFHYYNGSGTVILSGISLNSYRNTNIMSLWQTMCNHCTKPWLSLPTLVLLLLFPMHGAEHVHPVSFQNDDFIRSNLPYVLEFQSTLSAILQTQ